MSALAEDLLDDLNSSDEDGGDEEDEATQDNRGGDKEAASGGEDSDAADDDGGEDDDNIELLKKALQQKVKERQAVGSLRASSKYQDQLSEIKHYTTIPQASAGSLDEDDPEYKLVVTCNRIAQELDDEMDSTYQLITQIYNKKFPELESLVSNKLDYVKTVMRIGNEMDVSTVPTLTDLLPSSVVMIISVSASTTRGSRLVEVDWKDCLRACEEMMLLQEDKLLVLGFVESRMMRLAPNLVTIVGSRVAAQLVGLAGGVVALSKVPACNLEVLGHDKRNLGGLSSISSKTHFGVLAQCDLAQSCSNKLRRKAVKVIAAKVTLACRVDSYKKQNDDCSEGRRLRQQIHAKIDLWGQPDQARTKKALPVPDEKKKSRRGGKRARKMKERLGMSDFRAHHNKLTFSVEGGGEYGDSAMGFDNSSLTGIGGKADTGKLRAPQAKKNELHLSKRMKKALTASAGQVNGLASSIVQTNSGGFELARPTVAAAAERVKAANDKWFSANAGFMSVAAAPK